jgi:hypothetical protein
VAEEVDAAEECRSSSRWVEVVAGAAAVLVAVVVASAEVSVDSEAAADFPAAAEAHHGK